ncbi:MAG: glycosyltransferase family 2 protein [Candidatus Binatia bacterium]
MVTVVVAARERFGSALESLRSVFDHTGLPFRLIYVDGGSPARLHNRLQRLSRERGFTLIRRNHWLTGNEARNLALEQVDTRYTVFLENDVLVTPGWLEALVGCAEATGAAIVGPLQLLGPVERGFVHVAGGDCHIVTENGRRRFEDRRHFADTSLAEVRDQLKRMPCEQIEYHCMLVRTEAVRSVGLDPELRNSMEYHDLCMQLRARAQSVYFEPAALVTYLPGDRLDWYERAFFLWRWDERIIERSLQHFARKWNLDAEHPGTEATLNYARWHRKHAWHRLPLLGWIRPGWIRRRMLAPPARALGRFIALAGGLARRTA